jgi:hypothetical protein
MFWHCWPFPFPPNALSSERLLLLVTISLPSKCTSLLSLEWNALPFFPSNVAVDRWWPSIYNMQSLNCLQCLLWPRGQLASLPRLASVTFSLNKWKVEFVESVQMRTTDPQWKRLFWPINWAFHSFTSNLFLSLHPHLSPFSILGHNLLLYIYKFVYSFRLRQFTNGPSLP